MGRLLIEGIEIACTSEMEIPVTSENPLFYSTETYTQEIKIDLSFAINAKIYNHINRYNSIREIPANRRCQYIDNRGYVVLDGIEKITGVEDRFVRIIITCGKTIANVITSDLTFKDITFRDFVDPKDQWPVGSRTWYHKGDHFYYRQWDKQYLINEDWIYPPFFASCDDIVSPPSGAVNPPSTLGERYIIGGHHQYNFKGLCRVNNYNYNSRYLMDNLEDTVESFAEADKFFNSQREVKNIMPCFFLRTYLREIFFYFGYELILPSDIHRYNTYILANPTTGIWKEAVPKKLSIRKFIEDACIIFGIELEIKQKKVYAQKKNRVFTIDNSLNIEVEDSSEVTFSDDKLLQEFGWRYPDIDSDFMDQRYYKEENIIRQYPVVEVNDIYSNFYETDRKKIYLDKKQQKYYALVNSAPYGERPTPIGIYDVDAKEDLCFAAAPYFSFDERSKLEVRHSDDALRFRFDSQLLEENIIEYSMQWPISPYPFLKTEQLQDVVDFIKEGKESPDNEELKPIMIAQWYGIQQIMPYETYPSEMICDALSYGDCYKYNRFTPNIQSQMVPETYLAGRPDYFNKEGKSLRFLGIDGIINDNIIANIDRTKTFKFKFKWSVSFDIRKILFIRNIPYVCIKADYSIKDGDISELVEGEFLRVLL